VKDPIALIDGARTPIGKFGGAYRNVPAHELGPAAVKSALERSGVNAYDVDEVIMGCIGQVGDDAYNARRVAISAGLPEKTPAYTVNRLCGSGLQAVWSAAQQIAFGGTDVVVAGGDENITRMPFLDYAARDGYRLGDRTLIDGTLAILNDPFAQLPIGNAAEAVAQRYKVDRLAQDELAAESQRRAATAEAKIVFAAEITPVSVAGRRPTIIVIDEHPRPKTTLESLAGLRPAFAPGRASSSICP